MPSRALREWRTTQRAELDQLDTVLRQVRGTGPAERARRQRIVDMSIVLLAGHFQLCCRALHDEATTFLAGQVQPQGASGVLRDLLRARRALDHGNAQPDVLARDFERFGFKLWRELATHDPHNAARQDSLRRLHVWRNAIAHQSLPLPPKLATQVKGTGRDSSSIRS